MSMCEENDRGTLAADGQDYAPDRFPRQVAQLACLQACGPRMHKSQECEVFTSTQDSSQPA